MIDFKLVKVFHLKWLPCYGSLAISIICVLLLSLWSTVDKKKYDFDLQTKMKGSICYISYNVDHSSLSRLPPCSPLNFPQDLGQFKQTELELNPLNTNEINL